MYEHQPSRLSTSSQSSIRNPFIGRTNRSSAKRTGIHRFTCGQQLSGTRSRDDRESQGCQFLLFDARTKEREKERSSSLRFLSFQLVQLDRYYIRHDLVTLQSTSGLKKDRCIFLFNDLILITSCKRRSGTLTKKANNPVIVYGHLLPLNLPHRQ